MLVVAAGSALPWVTGLTGGTIYGLWHGSEMKDGTLTLVLSLVALGLFAFGITRRRRATFIVGLVLCVIIAVIAIVDINNVMSTTLLGAGNIGFGLYMVLICGILGVVAGAGGIATKREP